MCRLQVHEDDNSGGLGVIDAHRQGDETSLVTIETWWPKLPSDTRDWLTANNGGAVPPALLDQIELVGGPAVSDPWWTRADADSAEVLLPDDAVDWVEALANGESPATP